MKPQIMFHWSKITKKQINDIIIKNIIISVVVLFGEHVQKMEHVTACYEYFVG